LAEKTKAGVAPAHALPGAWLRGMRPPGSVRFACGAAVPGRRGGTACLLQTAAGTGRGACGMAGGRELSKPARLGKSGHPGMTRAANRTSPPTVKTGCTRNPYGI